jgi:hypothetical protein
MMPRLLGDTVTQNKKGIHHEGHEEHEDCAVTGQYVGKSNRQTTPPVTLSPICFLLQFFVYFVIFVVVLST